MSLISLDGLSDVAIVLVNRVAEGIGCAGRPWQIVRVARAEATAEQIRTQSEIDAQALRMRAMARLEAEEVRRQENIESILTRAAGAIDQNAHPERMSSDWIANWASHCRNVSDIQMQEMWAAVLAREAAQPGSFSRRTVNLLNDMDREDALLFRELCRFVWTAGEPMPVVFDANHEMYRSHGLSFGALQHLESLGLISFHVLGLKHSTDDYAEVSYFGRVLPLAKSKGQHMEFQVGKVMFSNSGLELSRLADHEPIEGFFEYCQGHWARLGFVQGVSSPVDNVASS